MSPSWSTDSRCGSMPSPSRSIHAIRELDWSCRLDRAVSDPLLRNHHVVDADGAGGVAEVGLGTGRQDPAQHLVGRPLDRRDRRDAEPLVDLGAAGVVDPGHDLLDAERLARHPRRDDVGVVTAGDRGERVGPPDAGLLEHGLVEAVAGDAVAVEVRPEPPEGVGLAVDDRHRVVPVLQTACERRTHSAAAHDHDVHARTVTQSRLATRQSTPGLGLSRATWA